MLFTTEPAETGLTDDQKASFPADASAANPLVGTNDERLSQVTTDDPATPASALRTLINWDCEVAPDGLELFLKPGRAVLITTSRTLILPQEAQIGDLYAIFISPAATTARVVLSITTGGIDAQSSKRYLAGAALVFRCVEITVPGGGTRKGLQTLQETSPRAVHYRGEYTSAAFYATGDLAVYQNTLYMRLIEGNGGAFDPTLWVGGAPNASSSLVPEVAAFQVKAPKVGAVALAALDEFVRRGKVAGWWATVKECWVPLGDFAASQVPLASVGAWTFTGFDAGDYSQETGYVVRANTSKSIATGFVPSANGLSSRNLTLAVATTVDAKPQSIFGRLVGTASGDGEALYVSNVENSFGVRGNALNHSFGLEGTVAVGTYDASVARCFLNGTFQVERPSTDTPLDDEILLFRSQRGNGLNYAEGSLGFYWLGTAMSKAQATDFSAAIMVLMARLRSIYQKEALEFFGDSITARSGTSQGGAARSYAHLVAQALGYRDKNNAQGGSELTRNTGDGAISGLNRFQPLVNTASAGVVLVYGTNDMASDSNTDGDGNKLQDYLISLAVVTSTLQEAGKRVVLGTPPYRADTGAHSLLKQQRYAAQVANRAVEHKTGFCDLLRAFTDTGNPAAYLADGVHPNDQGHALMAEYLLYAWRGLLVRKPSIDFSGAGFAGPTASVDVDVLGAQPGQSVQVSFISQVDAALLVSGYVKAVGVVALSFRLATAANLSTHSPAQIKLLVTVK